MTDAANNHGQLCAGRVVAITGAGRGIGRAEAIALAQHGACVVVNNRSAQAALDVVDIIRSAGGEAVAHVGDISDMPVAAELIELAVATYGRLDVLLNNAGIVRDRMLVNLTEDDWDEAIRVNLRGSFTTISQAARYWRDMHKAGQPIAAAIINTTSSAGLFRNPGQANYAAAKAGVTSLTIHAAHELARYGVTANALAPAAFTDMTAHLIDPAKRDVDGFDPFAAENVAPLAVWLASLQAREVTGRVFEVKGGRIAVAEGWRIGPEIDIGRRWEAGALAGPIAELLRGAQQNRDVSGRA
jgi:NAD(P)-dependent dehydrogenase (short-subunit alcohol dehydrogenase family)